MLNVCITFRELPSTGDTFSLGTKMQGRDISPSKEALDLLKMLIDRVMTSFNNYI